MHHLSVRSVTTIPQFLASISHFHAKAYFPSPLISLSVTRALEGAKRSFGRPSIQRKIITPDMLRSFSELVSPKISFPRLRTIWRVFMEFFGLLRFNEVAAMTLDDIIWTETGSTLSFAAQKPINTLKGLGFQFRTTTIRIFAPLRLRKHTCNISVSLPAILCLPCLVENLTLLPLCATILPCSISNIKHLKIPSNQVDINYYWFQLLEVHTIQSKPNN